MVLMLIPMQDRMAVVVMVQVVMITVSLVAVKEAVVMRLMTDSGNEVNDQALSRAFFRISFPAFCL